MNENRLGRKSVALFAAIFVCAGMGQSLHAQKWVSDMFAGKSHDFGIVPRGAKAEFSFDFKNKYQESLHIAGVRSSCGCTIPRFENATVKTYQTGRIICEFNTRSFIGPKSAVVTVVFDKPYYGEMQLMVQGNIRSDIVTEPGEVQFGEVELGAEKATSVRVSYAGTKNWAIKDVRSENTNLGVILGDPVRGSGGQIEYEMRVRVKNTAPVGAFSDQIVLVTNDRQYNLVTIPVRGKILPPLVLPDSVELGSVAVGGMVQDRIFMRGKQAFAITKIECADKRLSFMPKDGSRTTHVIPFKFNASDEAGAFREKITVYTTLQKDGVATTFVSGNVVGK